MRTKKHSEFHKNRVTEGKLIHFLNFYDDNTLNGLAGFFGYRNEDMEEFGSALLNVCQKKLTFCLET
jgi:hypothetical protein